LSKSSFLETNRWKLAVSGIIVGFVVKVVG
jgi:hypothetical protein